MLEVLDLSKNQLSCVIPTSMVNINFLYYLNLSSNTMSGKNPSVGQLQSFDKSAYIGNPHLCDEPLTDAHYSHIEEHENDRNREDKAPA